MTARYLKRVLFADLMGKLFDRAGCGCLGGAKSAGSDRAVSPLVWVERTNLFVAGFADPRSLPRAYFVEVVLPRYFSASALAQRGADALVRHAATVAGQLFLESVYSVDNDSVMLRQASVLLAPMIGCALSLATDRTGEPSLDSRGASRAAQYSGH